MKFIGGQYFDTDTYPTLSTDNSNQVVQITVIRVSGGTESGSQDYYINPDTELSDILSDDAFSDINLENKLSADATFSEDTTIYTAVYPDLDVTPSNNEAYTYSDGLLTLTEGGEYTVSMHSGVSSTSDTIKVTASDAVTVKLADVSISSSSAPPMEIDAAGNVTVTLEGDNTLTSTNTSYAGLQKTSTANTLTITSASGDYSTDGSLTATGPGNSNGASSAGIGGGDDGAGNNIEISGGTVTATGGYEGAAIGGGEYDTGSNITISGGYIIVTGGEYSTDIIGSGYGGSAASDISITGGNNPDIRQTRRRGGRTAGRRIIRLRRYGNRRHNLALYQGRI
ncbi:MAG: carbohydrate-binding domain-containing protein [Firmicutes bacterium]|nr:carbohydrate-binding domain-containing protein [Bacillota bacterium]